jgi:hypothetical protein
VERQRDFVVVVVVALLLGPKIFDHLRLASSLSDGRTEGKNLSFEFQINFEESDALELASYHSADHIVSKSKNAQECSV